MKKKKNIIKSTSDCNVIVFSQQGEQEQKRKNRKKSKKPTKNFNNVDDHESDVTKRSTVIACDSLFHNSNNDVFDLSFSRLLIDTATSLSRWRASLKSQRHFSHSFHTAGECLPWSSKYSGSRNNVL